jgi:hypothetical protein
MIIINFLTDQETITAVYVTASILYTVLLWRVTGRLHMPITK